jgi:hypothetical protein
MMTWLKERTGRVGSGKGRHKVKVDQDFLRNVSLKDILLLNQNYFMEPFC